ncbi:MAG: tRNA pseudouridine(38-40) synthase TruA [Gemmatimonadota bacterium]|nr:tRNA pseudouridine(38-40) synthase TruA [Gemmatimonadota bacterium]
MHYDGSAFHGWQYQPDQRTVQGELQATLSRLADSPRVAVGSGRTDAGVHATGQVASVDMPARWDAPTLRKALNATLPSDIWIQSAEVAPARFHPRFDAIARTYRYDVGTASLAASPFHSRWCWVVPSVLDVDLMRRAAQRIVGNHSFRAFAKSGQPERGDRCSVHRAEWTEWSLGHRFQITADRYLHHMVRYLVGTMVDIGRGKRPLEELDELLAGAPHVQTSPPAPPEGLFLALVEYPFSPSTAAPKLSGSNTET